MPTKLDKPRLIGMKIQSKTSEPRLEIGKELLRFVPMLKANDSVVRVAHDNHVASGASLPPLVDPLIIDMMEVNVCQERADDSPYAKGNLGRLPTGGRLRWAKSVWHRQVDRLGQGSRGE